MLRSQVQRQGSFYVCSSCRRQHQQNLARLRANSHTPGSAVPSTSRLLSSSIVSVSRRPAPREPRDAALPIDHDGGSPQSTTKARIDVRAYSSYGKFGSGILPGQGNANWAKGGSTIPGTTGSTSWGGGTNGSKIQPAQGTSSAWGTKAIGGGIQPAKATSIPGSNGNESSASGQQGATPAGPTAWAGRANTTTPTQSSIPGTAPHTRLADVPMGRDQTTPPQAFPGVDAAHGRSAATPGQPTATGGASSNSSGPTATNKPDTLWGTGPARSFRRTSGIQTLPGKGVLGQNTVFGAGLLPHEKLAIQGAQKPKPPPPPPSPSPPPPPPPPPHRAPKTEPRTQSPGFDDQEFSRQAPMRRGTGNPPPLPPGAEFPQLRRKWPNVDEFEALSPFNLPPKGTSRQGEAAGQATDPSPTPAPDRPRRKPPSGLPRSERYPPWGAPSELGAIAPDPVDNVRNSSMEKLRNIGGVAPDQVEIVSSISGTRPTQAPSQAPEKLVDPWSASPTSPPFEVPQATSGDPSQALGTQDIPESSGPVDVPSATQEAADAQIAGDVIANPLLGGTEGGSEIAESKSPDEQHAEKRREGDRKHPEHRELTWEERPRDRDRDVDRQGRGRGFDRPSGIPKRRSSNRRHDFDDDVDSGFDYEGYRTRKEEARRRKEEKRAAKEALTPKTILLPEYISISDLAMALGVRTQQFLEDLGELGFENVLHDSIMTGETAALVAAEYGFDPTVDAGDEEDLKPRPPPEDPTSLPPRPPIVTIMGHVDHGKTTMLDWLRKSSVAAQEQGGITQHIGAFTVRLSTGKVITFLDTPGHAAFLSMRQRGANVTDIVVLVVAVDDSVKPQTLEALKHAQNAKVPIIVAINKVDKDPHGVEQVKQDLAANGVEIEDFGGDVQVVAVSGKTGQGMDDLEESILTLSEILDVRSELNGMAEGWILEASVKKHHGKAATVLVKRGTMRVGDLVVAGTTYARIRMMRNEAGVAVQEAGPGTPVEVLGWRDSPMAGDMVLQAPDEDRAQAAVAYRQESADREKAAAQKGEEEVRERERAEQEALERMIAEEGEDAVAEAAAAAAAAQTGTKTVNLLVRGDVMGSVEAVSTAVMEIGNNEVRPRILRSSVGQVTESDVDLAATAKACIINFNNDVPGFIRRKADDQGVRILDHGIIYALVDEVKQMLSQQLAPLTSQRVLAEAEVLQVFAINVVKRQFKNIAGVRIRTGTVTRSGLYRVMRDGEKVHDGKLDTIKQGKKDVSEMRKGTECGLSFEDYDGFLPGDIIQLYEEITEKRYL